MMRGTPLHLLEHKLHSQIAPTDEQRYFATYVRTSIFRMQVVMSFTETRTVCFKSVHDRGIALFVLIWFQQKLGGAHGEP